MKINENLAQNWEKISYFPTKFRWNSVQITHLHLISTYRRLTHIVAAAEQQALFIKALLNFQPLFITFLSNPDHGPRIMTSMVRNLHVNPYIYFKNVGRWWNMEHGPCSTITSITKLFFCGGYPRIKSENVGRLTTYTFRKYAPCYR